MSWSDNLLDASFRGVRFDCISTDDNTERATAEHSYPYKDGADIEDLGRGPRRVSVEAVFWGADYDMRLQQFLAVLAQAGAGDLVHPVFGPMRAQLTSYRINHEAENPDYCTVSLEFIESTPGNPFFDRTLAVQQAASIGQHAASTRVQASTVTAARVEKISALAGAYGRVAALRETMTGALSDIRARVTGFIGSGLDVIDYPLSWASDIGGALNGLLDLRPFNTETLMADWRAVFERASQPVLLPSFGGNTVAAEDSRYIGAHVALEQSLITADAAAILLTAETETPSLSPREIEQVVNDVRTLLQASIDAYRTLYAPGNTLSPTDPAWMVVEGLKDTAAAIQTAARSVLEVHPPLVSRRNDAPGNLHLLAHRLYGDYTRATELWRLNPQLRNPNDLQAEVLSAYAE